ncbi:MAG: hypothetical protein ACYDAY_11455 [Candidatus Dormibacteria bacterium]
MARVDATGAEQGTLNELDSTSVVGSGTVQSSTAQARSGARSWHFKVTAGTDAATGTLSGPLPATTSFAIRGSIFVPTGGISVANDDTVLKITFASAAGSQGLALHAILNAGKLRLRVVGSNTTGAYAGGTLDVSGLAFDTWHDFCIKGTVNTSPSATETYDFRVNRGAYQTATAGDYAAGVLSSGSIVMGYAAAGGGASECFLDDIIIDDVNADINDARFLAYLRPDADDEGHGSPSAWTTIGGGAASKHAAISDGSDATWIQAPGGGATDKQEGIGLSDIAGTLPAGAVLQAIYGSWRHTGTVPAQFAATTFAVQDAAGNTSAGPFSAGVGASTVTDRSCAVAAITSKAASDVAGFVLLFDGNPTSGVPSVEVFEAWAYVEVAVTASLTDSASASDAVSSDSATLTTSDSLAESSTLASLTNATAGSDSAALSDVLTTLSASFALNEAPSLADALVLTVVFALADSAAAADSAQVSVTFPTQLDAATLADTLTALTALNPLTDAPIFSELLQLLVDASVSDSAGASEAVATSVTFPTLTDAITATDLLVALTATVPLLDTNAVAEVLVALVSLGLADTTSVADSVQLRATATVAEVLTAADALGILVDASLLDPATLTESLPVKVIYSVGGGGSTVTYISIINE